jgi:hypothetical protein
MSKTTCVAGARYIALMKDPSRRAVNRRLELSIPTEVIEARGKAPAGIEDEPMPMPTPPPSLPESSSSQPPAPRSVSPPPMPPPPAPSTGGGLCITFINKCTPIFYAYEPNGTITLTDHSGQPIR